MNCPKCGSKMVQLLVSYVCDNCDSKKSVMSQNVGGDTVFDEQDLTHSIIMGKPTSIIGRNTNSIQTAQFQQGVGNSYVGVNASKNKKTIPGTDFEYFEGTYYGLTQKFMDSLIRQTHKTKSSLQYVHEAQVVLAGGTIRDLSCQQHPQDIDIFCSTKKIVDEVEIEISKFTKIISVSQSTCIRTLSVASSDIVTVGRGPGIIDIQLICVKTMLPEVYITPLDNFLVKDLIATFDLTMNSAATMFDGNQNVTVIHNLFESDANNKIMRIADYGISKTKPRPMTIPRFMKFLSRGYKVVDNSNFCYSWQNACKNSSVDYGDLFKQKSSTCNYIPGP